MSTVGKCPSCLFALDWKKVEGDMKGDRKLLSIVVTAGVYTRSLMCAQRKETPLPVGLATASACSKNAI